MWNFRIGQCWARVIFLSTRHASPRCFQHFFMCHRCFASRVIFFQMQIKICLPRPKCSPTRTHTRTATFHPSRQSYFNKSWTTELELGQNGTAPQHWQQPFKYRSFFVVSPDNESFKKNSKHRVTCRFFAFASMTRYRKPWRGCPALELGS